jgi:hypothetical protein
MKNLDLNKSGVLEMNANEIQITEGGVSDVFKDSFKPFNPFPDPTFPMPEPGDLL